MRTEENTTSPVHIYQCKDSRVVEKCKERAIPPRIAIALYKYILQKMTFINCLEKNSKCRFQGKSARCKMTQTSYPIISRKNVWSEWEKKCEKEIGLIKILQLKTSENKIKNIVEKFNRRRDQAGDTNLWTWSHALNNSLGRQKSKEKIQVEWDTIRWRNIRITGLLQKGEMDNDTESIPNEIVAEKIPSMRKVTNIQIHWGEMTPIRFIPQRSVQWYNMVGLATPETEAKLFLMGARKSAKHHTRR